MVIKVTRLQLLDGALELGLRVEQEPRQVVETEGVVVEEQVRPLAKCRPVVVPFRKVVSQ